MCVDSDGDERRRKGPDPFLALQSHADTVAVMDRPTAWRLLEVTATSTPAEIQKAYKAKARHWHPDNQATGNAALFDMCNEARDLLIDGTRRAEPPIPGGDYTRPGPAPAATTTTQDPWGNTDTSSAAESMWEDDVDLDDSGYDDWAVDDDIDLDTYVQENKVPRWKRMWRAAAGPTARSWLLHNIWMYIVWAVVAWYSIPQAIDRRGPLGLGWMVAKMLGTTTTQELSGGVPYDPPGMWVAVYISVGVAIVASFIATAVIANSELPMWGKIPLVAFTTVTVIAILLGWGYGLIPLIAVAAFMFWGLGKTNK